MTAHVYVDETKQRGYVLAAVTVADPAAVRKVVNALVAPGNRRLHMHNERPRRRVEIVEAVIATTGISVVLYDAARTYRTDRYARAACLDRLVADLAATDGETRLIIERDETLVSFDSQRLIEATRAAGCRDRLGYSHTSAHVEPLLALPDMAAWCWARSPDWRRRIDPVLTAVRTV